MTPSTLWFSDNSTLAAQITLDVIKEVHVV